MDEENFINPGEPGYDQAPDNGGFVGPPAPVPLTAQQLAPADTWSPAQGPKIYNRPQPASWMTPTQRAHAIALGEQFDRFYHDQSLAPHQRETALDELTLMKDRPFTQADSVRLSSLQNGVSQVQADLTAGRINEETARNTLREIYTPMGVLQAQKQATKSKAEEEHAKTAVKMEAMKQGIFEHNLKSINNLAPGMIQTDPDTGTRYSMKADGTIQLVPREKPAPAVDQDKEFDLMLKRAEVDAKIVASRTYPEGAYYERHPDAIAKIGDEAAQEKAKISLDNYRRAAFDVVKSRMDAHTAKRGGQQAGPPAPPPEPPPSPAQRQAQTYVQPAAAPPPDQTAPPAAGPVAGSAPAAGPTLQEYQAAKNTSEGIFSNPNRTDADRKRMWDAEQVVTAYEQTQKAAAPAPVNPQVQSAAIRTLSTIATRAIAENDTATATAAHRLTELLAAKPVSQFTPEERTHAKRWQNQIDTFIGRRRQAP